MSILLILLGIAGIVTGLVIWIVSLIKKRKNTIKSALIVFVSLVMFIAGVVTFDTNGIKEVANPQKDDKYEEQRKKEDDSDNLASLYNDKVKKWKGQVVAEYDTWWKTNWKGAMSDLEDGSKTSEEVVADLKKLRDTHYSGLIKYINDYEPPEKFTDEQMKKIRKFKSKMVEALQKRNESVTEMIGMLNSPETTDIEKVEKTVNEADELALSGIASITELESDLGVLEE